MGNIHRRIIEAAKRGRSVSSINLCISFQLPDSLASRAGEREDEHDQRVNSWLYDMGAYRAIKGYANYKNPDLPEPALAYKSYELSEAVLLSLKNSDCTDDHKYCNFCVFDVVGFAKQSNLDLDSWLLAQAQFAALAWPAEARRVDISPPDENFILALERQYLAGGCFSELDDSDDDDCWDNDSYSRLADSFCDEIRRRNRVYQTPVQPSVPTLALATGAQETEQLKAEIELLSRRLAEVTAERDTLLVGVTGPQMETDSNELPPLIRMAIEVFQQHWHGQLDPLPEVRARANQVAIVSGLRTHHPEITEAIAKAIDKVASPIDRDPKNTTGRYRLRYTLD